MKKAISLLLSVCMLLSVIGSIDISVFAANTTYSYDRETSTLTIEGSGVMETWTLNEVVSTSTFTPPSAYYRFGIAPEDIRNVIIKEGVTTIGDYAFYNCTELESVTIPSSVKTIYTSAFEKSSKLTKTNYTGTASQWCQIGFKCIYSNPIYYSQNLYINNSLLTNAEIKNLYTISSYAFYNCKSLESVAITNVQDFGNDIFYNCSGIKEVSVPCSLCWSNNNKNILFNKCLNLEKVTFTKGTGTWCNYTQYIPTPEYKESLKEVVIEEGVKSIGTNVFYGCRKLEKVTIPDSVLEICDYAFYECVSLKNIYLSNKLQRIGEFAFCWSGLINIKIPDSVTSIKKGAFSDCINLTNATLSSNDYLSIEGQAFSSCKKAIIYIPNPNCSIEREEKTLECKLIRACSNSTAETYANAYSKNFEIAHSYKTRIIPSTCINQGYTEDVCEFCSASAKYDYIPIIDHSWDNGVVISQPSCTKEGKMTYTCSYCGETRIESISKSKHNSVIDKKIEPTCTTTGLSEGSHCSVCGITLTEQKVLPMIDHLWDKGTVSLEPSCSKEGKLTYSCLSCGQTTDEVLPEIGHDLLETVTPNEPHKKIVTCSNRVKTLELDHSSYPESTHPYSNNENKTYSFSYPNANEYIVKFSDSTELENNYDFIYVYDSTGNQIGKYTGTQLKSKEIVIKSANFEIKLTSDSSQTKYGFSIDSIYAILPTEEKCNYYQEIITEHDYVVVEAQKATCNDDGYNKYQCSICGDEYTEYVFSEGHTYIDEIVAATCTQDGYTSHTCFACGDAYVNNKTAALGHHFSEWIYNGDSQFVSLSNYKNGTQTRTCSECGEEETIEAPNTALLRRRGTALSLESSITLTTYITKDVVDYYDDVYAEFTRNDKKEIVRASDKIFKSGSTVYNVFDYTGISPQAMGDDIEVVFYGIKDGVKYWGNPYSISATSYIQTMLNTNTSSAKLKTMLVDLLYYGEACQVYQNYKTDKLMTSILTEKQKQLRSTGELELNNIRDASYKTCENRLVRLGSALKLSNAVEMAIPLNMTDVTLEELTIKVKIGTRDLEYTCADNPEKFKKEKDGYWYFYFDGVYANQMSDEVFITAYRGDEQVSYTLKYNVESYAATVTDPKLKKVTDAMMRYGNSAKAYSCK